MTDSFIEKCKESGQSGNFKFSLSPPRKCWAIHTACDVSSPEASGRLAQESLVATVTIGREAIGLKRLFRGVVEDPNLHDLSCLFRRRYGAPKFAGDTHQLLDLLDGAHLARARLIPEHILDAAPHM